MKFLLLGLLVVAALLWLTHERRKETRATRTARTRRPSSGEAMHQCACCRAFFPASEAVRTPSGAVFCCEEHRRLGPGA